MAKKRKSGTSTLPNRSVKRTVARTVKRTVARASTEQDANWKLLSALIIKQRKAAGVPKLLRKYKY
ncbi:unnamed protein product, partial [marine sediment metagenome]